MGCKCIHGCWWYKGCKGINRYIVGCKSALKLRFVENFQRINRYIVGCKLDERENLQQRDIELIDT